MKWKSLCVPSTGSGAGSAHRFICQTGLLLATLAPVSVSGQITVAKEVHVSASRKDLVLNEVLLSADPSNPNRLITCAIGNVPEYVTTKRLHQGTGAMFYANVFMSDDGGKSWRSAFEHVPEKDRGGLDNHCAFGAMGDAFVVIGIEDPAPRDTADKSEYPAGSWYTVLRRSTDGGKTWSPEIRLPQGEGIDRQYVIADDTHGKYHDRVYVTGQTRATNIDGESQGLAMTLWRSLDNGATWNERPLKRTGKKYGSVFNPWNPVIMADGTLAVIAWDQSESQGLTRLPMKIIMSYDGGETFHKAFKVADVQGFSPPASLAVDRSNGPFKGRLYTAWADSRSGRSQMLLVHSDDGGKTWSAPVVVTDDRARIDTSKGPTPILPIVTVNKDGVVGAMWYDRRDNPDDRGYWPRFSASLDGGDTWLPSVRISSAAKTYIEGERTTLTSTASIESSGSAKVARVSIGRRDWAEGGHTSGLAADGNGRFQAVWVDDRTGLHQMWGTTITVGGMVAKNGGGELASYTDITSKAQVVLVGTNYDERGKRISATVRLKNISKDTIRGSVKLRLLSTASDIALVKAANSENGVSGPGAVWDFSSLLQGGVLLPDQESGDKQLLFSLSDVRSFKDVALFKSNVLSFEAKVLAK
jgi:hypothetical protein